MLTSREHLITPMFLGPYLCFKFSDLSMFINDQLVQTYDLGTLTTLLYKL